LKKQKNIFCTRSILARFDCEVCSRLAICICVDAVYFVIPHIDVKYPDVPGTSDPDGEKILI